MPKNQFQRPLAVNHGHNVPRHGKPQPLPGKMVKKAAVKAPATSLPPLEHLLAETSHK